MGGKGKTRTPIGSSRETKKYHTLNNRACLCMVIGSGGSGRLRDGDGSISTIVSANMSGHYGSTARMTGRETASRPDRMATVTGVTT